MFESKNKVIWFERLFKNFAIVIKKIFTLPCLEQVQCEMYVIWNKVGYENEQFVERLYIPCKCCIGTVSYK